ncbi:uncharacterized protein LOC132925477 [Rhopalosiphum padi]|uniref:uncharacterized protein LOC132925477 n=1 Tax=Rhopalosiphum padi TaxID=40932 RepID=UPI00298DFA4C|nr:uncharacterized protein LOC132925477 [Rhopalosiphum padi]
MPLKAQLTIRLFVSGLELQKKWKGIRDAYVKEVKNMKQVKSGSGAEKSSYLYYRRLQFLQPTIKKNSTESSFEIADVGGDGNLESSTETSIEEDSSRVPNEERTFKSPLQQRKKIKLHPADEHFANIIEKSLNQRNTVDKKEDDEDKLFCLSLYKEIKKVPDAMRLKTKIEIYNLLLKNQAIQTHTQPSSTDTSKSNHVSTPYSQQNTQRYAYPQYDRPNYTTIPTYDTLRYNHIYTQFNQNMEPLQAPSPLSTNSEISQESSDLDLFG